MDPNLGPLPLGLGGARSMGVPLFGTWFIAGS